MSVAAPWTVNTIGVIGPGIVGMPMAAMLAAARIRIGTDTPARVMVVQRESPTSGWKVAAINRGESVIGGIEPALDAIVSDMVREGLLGASHDPAVLTHADVIMVCVQTDKDGIGPDYGPLNSALDGLIAALQQRPATAPAPLIVFESTLAPSSMTTLIRERFAAGGLRDGHEVLLGNSPNRVMPGRLVERITTSDKLAGGLSPLAATRIAQLYGHIVTGATVHPTASLTAEIVKTLENAYRDVRIAFATEVARQCDRQDVDFLALRDAVNATLAQGDAFHTDAATVPTGALLGPMIGVGGHCLPKDGVLLWWRAQTAPAGAGAPDPATSLVLASRHINDAQPQWIVQRCTDAVGPLAGRTVAVLGAAYRADADDTRNAPGLSLARVLQEAGAVVRVHDPFVRPTDVNLRAAVAPEAFSHDLAATLHGAEVAIICVAHAPYRTALQATLAAVPGLQLVMDGANVVSLEALRATGRQALGVGRGAQAPTPALVQTVAAAFRAVEVAVANEVESLVEWYDATYRGPLEAPATFADVSRLAATCPTGCAIATPGPVPTVPDAAALDSRLLTLALSVERAHATS